MIAMGESEMRQHAKQKGEAVLERLLGNTHDPYVINDAVYELVEVGDDLALDDEKEREAIEKLTTETTNWTLDESPVVLKQKTDLLVAAWDTLGWILYKEGKFKESKSYIDATWMNMGDIEVSKHRDAVNAALSTPDKRLQQRLPRADTSQ